MKKFITILLSVIILMTISSCVTEEKYEENITPKDTVMEGVKQISETTPAQQSFFENVKMPEPFEYVGGDENDYFYSPCIDKFNRVESGVIEHFKEYLESELIGKWGDLYNSLEPVYSEVTNLMDFPNIFELIISNDIPDNVVIAAINEHNDFYKEFYKGHDDEQSMLDYIAFSQEDIDALLTRDEAIVTAHFATDEAIITNNNIFSPYWLYCHTPEDYEEAGITPEMIEEKIEMYAAFEFSNEAEAAFEEKLSSFIGAEVSLNNGNLN